jgi:hypothetical protein
MPKYINESNFTNKSAPVLRSNFLPKLIPKLNHKHKESSSVRPDVKQRNILETNSSSRLRNIARSQANIH